MIDLTSKRIVVTGGTGFLGRHIVEELFDRGCDSVCVPDHADYDLCQFEDVDRMYQRLRPEIVINCAALIGGIGMNKSLPASMFLNNMQMGMNLIEWAYRYKVEKFVQLGTVCEYPKFTPAPFREDDLWNGYPEETNAPYGVAKRALLTMGWAYRKQYGLNVIHPLPVNLYGPHDNFNPETSHVIPALIRKFQTAKLTNNPVVQVWGSGVASREFLYVEDGARGIVLATERYDGSDPVNIGTGTAIQINSLATMIAFKIGYKGTIVYDSTQPDGQPVRQLNIERAQYLFDFKATTSFSDGLDKTIDWYTRTYANE